MVGRVPYEIERLLAEAGGGLDAPAREALRARLAASLAEGLEPRSGTNRKADDIARLAAFLDGRLTGAEREAFIHGLAEAPSRRTELDSAAALLDAVGGGGPVAPALLAQAADKFAPAAAAPALAAARPSWWANARPGMRGIRIAATAALAALVLVPAIAVVGKRLQPEPPRYKIPAPVSATPTVPAEQAEKLLFGPRYDAMSNRGQEFLGGARQPSPAASMSAPIQSGDAINEPGCDTPEGLSPSRSDPREVSVAQARKETRSLRRNELPCRPTETARPRLVVPAAPPPAVLAVPPVRQ
jgi:hypothetical protein